MSGLLWNTLLAVVWMMITGNFEPGNLALGFLLGFLIVFFVGPVIGVAGYTTRVIALLRLVLFFLVDLIRSNLRMAYDVVWPRMDTRPGVVAVPIDANSDIEIVLLANLITLTPGSLSLDVSDDRNTLYLHVMDLRDPDGLIRKVKNGYERRILAVTRG